MEQENKKDPKTFATGNHILIGLGGTGGKILKAFKMRMYEEFPTDEERKQPVALLYVDSTDEMMPQNGRPRADFRVMGQDASFAQNEFLNIKAVDVDQILEHIDNYPTVRGIVNNVASVKKAIGSLGQAAGQKRRAGRLLFAANANRYINSLKDAYARCEQISSDSSKLSIHIFAGLCGGTGSGSIVDVILQTRKTFPNAIISVYAMIPELNLPKSDIDQGRYYQNGYAALMELNALQTGRWKPQDVTGMGPADLYNDRVKGVADGITLYSNVNDNGLTINSLEELPKVVSDYLFARVFLISPEDAVNNDMIRAYTFENMDDFAFEKDETANPDEKGAIPVARTKKINSFGMKRVMYPELRILKHITYSIGESVLYQFKFNNWRENQGFVDQERNKDYRAEYLNANNLSNWMLDLEHLTLNKKILESDNEFTQFKDYWQDKAIGYAEEAKDAECPLNELQDILTDFYVTHFREEGVENYFQGKERVIPELSSEIRHKIESELFEKWKVGDISIVELQKVSKLLIDKVGEISKELEAEGKAEAERCLDYDEERNENVSEWANLGVLQRMINKGNRLYADHQNILADYFTSKTMMVAIEFAKKLVIRLRRDICKMDEDISAFAQKITDAITQTEKLIAAQRKVNKGLEDMRSAIIEVCEEEAMDKFEENVKIDKVDMPNIAFQLRNVIIPEGPFLDFGRLADDINTEDITDAFDIKLSEIIKQRHSDKASSEKKVLGLNILTQLRQKLKTDDDIKSFAHKIVAQSGVYLQLNQEQLQLHLRNNEGNQSPSNPASIHKKVILVSIPSPNDDERLHKFVDKLESALKSEVKSGEQISITINRKSPRKDELTIMTVSYCYPMRCIDWLKGYKLKYEQFLNTGNVATDQSNAILLHCEGDGTNLPNLFPVDNAAAIAAEAALKERAEARGEVETTSSTFGNEISVEHRATAIPGIPPMPGMPSLPPMPPAPNAEPKILLYMSVQGQQYGPYDNTICKQLVANRQLTPESYVWMEGMANWVTAGNVPELKFLFASATPPQMPGLPPMPPVMPPIN